jgi:uncharacterized protein DUF6599
MRTIRPIFAICLLSAVAARAEAAAPPILPESFAGWQMTGKAQSGSDPAIVDQAYAPLLKEYGFTDFATATYIREGRKLTVKAARFADASGAYGAFTFYKQQEMLTEKIGDQGASLNERVLFYRGNILVDAVFQKLSAMSAAELRDLAEALPLPAGSARNLPNLQTLLPRINYVKNSAKYVLGPLALEKVGVPLDAGLVNFGTGAELVLGNYTTDEGSATLVLISYPTPQIAVERVKAIEAAKGSTAGSDPHEPSAFVKRSGPIVAVASGQISAKEARSLLALVSYDADVTWNENTSFTKKDNLANLLVNIILLCFILIGLAMVAGLVFGGFRIVMKRFFPDRVFDRPGEMEIISLHLNRSLDNREDSIRRGA